MNACVKKEIPDGWVWTTLGETFKWGSGGTPKRTNPKYYGGDIPWLIIGDLNDGPVGDSETKITEEGLKNSSAKWVEPGSVLLAMYGSIGKLGIATERVTTNQAIAFTHAESNDAKYLFYYLMFSRDALAREGKGATQLNISQTVIKAFPFPLAPLEQQKRIVAKIEELFSHIDAGIEALKKAKQLLKQYRQSVLKAAVTGELTDSSSDWKVYRISELGKVVTGNTPSKKDPDNFGGGIPFFKPAEIDAGINVVEAKENLTHKGAEKARLLPKKTVMVVCIGATIGKAGLSQVDGCTNQQINSVVCDKSIVIPEFLYYFFESPLGKKKVISNASATTLPILNKSKFSELTCNLPEIRDQNEIIEIVKEKIEKITRLEKEIDFQLLKTERNKQSILASAFSGEL